VKTSAHFAKDGNPALLMEDQGFCTLKKRRRIALFKKTGGVALLETGESFCILKKGEDAALLGK
jgi:hypothetical protein